MKAMTNNRGQATIEALIAATCVMGFLVLLLAMFYLFSLRAHLQFTSHELLVCRQYKNPSMCDFEFQKDLRSFMSFGRIQSIQTGRSSKSQSLTLKMAFSVVGFQEFQWTYKDQITLPLRR